MVLKAGPTIVDPPYMVGNPPESPQNLRTSVPPPGAEPPCVSSPASDASPAALHQLERLDSRRALARVIDLLLVIGASATLGELLGLLGWMGLLLMLWASVVYFFVSESLTGQTVGKAVMGLRVVRRDGGPARANAIAARNVIRIAEEPVLAVISLVATGRRRRQRIGDLAAGTTVGRAADSRPPARSAMVWAYPMLWGLGALAFGVLAEPRQPVDPSRPYAEGSEAMQFLSGAESLCRAHTRFFDDAGEVPANLIYKRELSLMHDTASLEAPEPMIPIRDRLVAARRRLAMRVKDMMSEVAGSADANAAAKPHWPGIYRERYRTYELYREFGMECTMQES